jgi:hypothetical protein
MSSETTHGTRIRSGIVDRAEVQGWADIGRFDVAVIDAEIEDQRDFGDEQKAEEEGEAAQRFLAALLERLIIDLVNAGAEHVERRHHDDGGQIGSRPKSALTM